jgi:hypothetical protein
MTEKWNFDRKDQTVLFFSISMATVCIGLILGGVIDATVRKIQGEKEWKERKYLNALSFFLLQASINIIILILLTKTTVYFLPWFQLSVSGALFAVLLFIAQRNLVDNSLRITNF